VDKKGWGEGKMELIMSGGVFEEGTGEAYWSVFP
jgi:hypothetical protein